MKTIHTAVLGGAVALATLAGCATRHDYYTSTAPAAPAAVVVAPSPVATAPVGTIVAIDTYSSTATSTTGVGAVAGGVIGGVAGHQIGNGRGRDVATVAGAIGGALAGNEIEKDRNADTVAGGYRVTIRYDDGSAQAVNMASIGDLRVGDRVRFDTAGELIRY